MLGGVLVSDADRERTVRRLRAGHLDGALGGETFEHRVEAALHARRREQLEALTADLPRRRRAVRDALSTLLAGQEDPWPDAVPVTPPGWLDPPVVLGRSRSCDVRLGDATVSARHLELRPLTRRDRWLAIDLGSLNGTWIHDHRVGRVVIAPGDVLLLGGQAVRVDA